MRRVFCQHEQVHTESAKRKTSEKDLVTQLLSVCWGQARQECPSTSRAKPEQDIPPGPASDS